MSFFVSSIKEAVRLARSGQWIKYIINEITVEHCLSSPTTGASLSYPFADLSSPLSLLAPRKTFIELAQAS